MMRPLVLAPNSIALDDVPTEVVALTSLRAADSPRLSGQDNHHIKRLAQTEEKLPPVVVHRESMRVIDGMHRVRAAELRGDHEIEVTFFWGDEEAAFLLSVQSNIAHGLPLTLADRTAAATRILRSHPDWSDRAVGQVVGLAHATVGALRRRMSIDAGHQFSSRLGHDGRMRALNTAQARTLAAGLIASDPGASLRKIAEQVGLSPATVRDVRMRLMRGDDPVPAKQRRIELVAGVTELDETKLEQPRTRRPRPRSLSRAMRKRQPTEVWERLRRDPALRSSESGRALLRWLAERSNHVEEWPQFVDHVPSHCLSLMAEMARSMAETWTAFAEDLDRRAADQP